MDKKILLNADYVKLKYIAKGWTFEEFAGRLGIVPNTLRKYLTTAEVRISIVNKMAKILDVNADQLIYVELERGNK